MQKWVGTETIIFVRGYDNLRREIVAKKETTTNRKPGMLSQSKKEPYQLWAIAAHTIGIVNQFDEDDGKQTR